MIVLKTVLEHEIAQERAVRLGGGRYCSCIDVRGLIHAVECGTEIEAAVAPAYVRRSGAIDFWCVVAIERRRDQRDRDNREIDSAAPGVPRFVADIAKFYEVRLVDARVELSLHFLVVCVASPSQKVIDRSLRTIAIVDHKRQVGRCELGLNLCERTRGRACENTFGCEISGYASSDKIVPAEIADFLLDGRGDIAQVDEAIFQRAGIGRGRR